MTVEWVTPEELAAELKLPVKTLYTWKARGYGPTPVRLGRHLRYRRSDIDQWIRTRYAP